VNAIDKHLVPPTMSNIAKILLLLPLLASVGHAAPISSTELDTTFATTFEKFFRIKDLIDNINIKHFRELQGRKSDGAEPIIKAIEDAASSADAGGDDADADAGGDAVLTEIDLTEEAISNDQVTKTVSAEDTEASSATEASLTDDATVGFEEVTLGEGGTSTALGETTTEASGQQETSTEAVEAAEAETTTAATVAENDTEEDESLNEIDTDGFVVSQDTLDSAKKYGYKILLKKVGNRRVPVGKIKFSLPIYYHQTQLIEVTDASAAETTTSASVPEAASPPAATTTAAPPAVTEAATELPTTAAQEDIVETTTSPAVEVKELSAEDPIISDLPEIDTVDQNSIEEGALQVKADTELAVAEIENLNQTTVLSSSECAVPLVDSQKLLVDLATKIVDSASVIEEILAVARSIKDELDPAALSLSGARLLQLLEPFLESLVPVEIAGCPDTSTNLLMTMTGMAATLDTIAEQPGVEAARAESLHQAATSLQLAAWAMAQLQSSVHTLYSGVCEEGETSAADILASLARALEGYVPMLAMLSTDTSVEELRETTEALQKAADDISGVEQRSGSRLPGVECGASFSDMSAGLERLADFLEATQEV